MNRMLRRSRQEESKVSLEYLQGIHEKHEDWLLSASNPRGLAASEWHSRGQSLPTALQSQLNSGAPGVLQLQALQEPEAIAGKVSLAKFSSNLAQIQLNIRMLW